MHPLRSPSASSSAPPLPPGTVAFVHWTNVQSLSGRRVLLDADGRVVYAIPTQSPILDLRDAIIVHPRVGAMMKKVTRRDREQVPAGVVALASMVTAAVTACEAAADPLVAAAGSALNSCSACSMDDFDAADLAQVSQCCMCMMSWHSVCIQHLMECHQCVSVLASAKLSRSRLPPLFGERAALCTLCDTLMLKH